MEKMWGSASFRQREDRSSGRNGDGRHTVRLVTSRVFTCSVHPVIILSSSVRKVCSFLEDSL